MIKHVMEDDADEAYDRFVDDVLCSDAFQKCNKKDKDSNCMLDKDKSRCWHVVECPLGKRRK